MQTSSSIMPTDLQSQTPGVSTPIRYRFHANFHLRNRVVVCGSKKRIELFRRTKDPNPDLRCSFVDIFVRHLSSVPLYYALRFTPVNSQYQYSSGSSRRRRINRYQPFGLHLRPDVRGYLLTYEREVLFQFLNRLRAWYDGCYSGMREDELQRGCL